MRSVTKTLHSRGLVPPRDDLVMNKPGLMSTQIMPNHLPTEADVVVAGAGVIGMLTAWNLHQHGLDVMLLDQQRPFAGSSWAGGGILCPVPQWQYPPQVDELVRASSQLYPALIDHLQAVSGVALDYATTGLLFTGPYDAMAEPWRQQHADDVDRGVLQDWQPECDQRPAWLLKNVAQLRNPRLGKALLAVCRQCGLAVLPDHALVDIQPASTRRLSVHCGNGEKFAADHVVIAAGAWTDELLRQCGLSGFGIKPLRGQMLLLQGQPGRLRHIISGHGKYLIPRPDGLILCGSTVEDVGFDTGITDAARDEILAACCDLYPPAAELPILQQWSGLRPGIADDIPVIAEHPQCAGVWINSGHYRNGLGMAPASAQRLADLIAQSAMPID